ncbi:uncharacterized protein [Amphiura filiformis]|uniref:uncharacterized protein n=1 Tax=Amphiura filiformis TaxID=82378 RepID=UPI003B21B08A
MMPSFSHLQSSSSSLLTKPILFTTSIIESSSVQFQPTTSSASTHGLVITEISTLYEIETVDLSTTLPTKILSTDSMMPSFSHLQSSSSSLLTKPILFTTSIIESSSLQFQPTTLSASTPGLVITEISTLYEIETVDLSSTLPTKILSTDSMTPSISHLQSFSSSLLTRPILFTTSIIESSSVQFQPTTSSASTPGLVITEISTLYDIETVDLSTTLPTKILSTGSVTPSISHLQSSSSSLLTRPILFTTSIIEPSSLQFQPTISSASTPGLVTTEISTLYEIETVDISSTLPTKILSTGSMTPSISHLQSSSSSLLTRPSLFTTSIIESSSLQFQPTTSSASTPGLVITEISTLYEIETVDLSSTLPTKILSTDSMMPSFSHLQSSSSSLLTKPILFTTSIIESSSVQFQPTTSSASTPGLVITEISTLYEIETVDLLSTMASKILSTDSMTPNLSHLQSFSSSLLTRPSLFTTSIIKPSSLQFQPTTSSTTTPGLIITEISTLYEIETVDLSTTLPTKILSTDSMTPSISQLQSYSSSLLTRPILFTTSIIEPSSLQFQPTISSASTPGLVITEISTLYEIETVDLSSTLPTKILSTDSIMPSLSHLQSFPSSLLTRPILLTTSIIEPSSLPFQPITLSASTPGLVITEISTLYEIETVDLSSTLPTKILSTDSMTPSISHLQSSSSSLLTRPSLFTTSIIEPSSLQFQPITSSASTPGLVITEISTLYEIETVDISSTMPSKILSTDSMPPSVSHLQSSTSSLLTRPILFTTSIIEPSSLQFQPTISSASTPGLVITEISTLYEIETVDLSSTLPTKILSTDSIMPSLSHLQSFPSSLLTRPILLTTSIIEPSSLPFQPITLSASTPGLVITEISTLYEIETVDLSSTLPTKILSTDSMTPSISHLQSSSSSLLTRPSLFTTSIIEPSSLQFQPITSSASTPGLVITEISTLYEIETVDISSTMPSKILSTDSMPPSVSHLQSSTSSLLTRPILFSTSIIEPSSLQFQPTTSSASTPGLVITEISTLYEIETVDLSSTLPTKILSTASMAPSISHLQSSTSSLLIRPILFTTSIIEPSSLQFQPTSSASTPGLVITEISTLYEIETVDISSTMPTKILSTDSMTPGLSPLQSFSSSLLTRPILFTTSIIEPSSLQFQPITSSASTPGIFITEISTLYEIETVDLSSTLPTKILSTDSMTPGLSHMQSSSSSLLTRPILFTTNIIEPSSLQFQPTSSASTPGLFITEISTLYEIETVDLSSTLPTKILSTDSMTPGLSHIQSSSSSLLTSELFLSEVSTLYKSVFLTETAHLSTLTSVTSTRSSIEDVARSTSSFQPIDSNLPTTSSKDFSFSESIDLFETLSTTLFETVYLSSDSKVPLMSHFPSFELSSAFSTKFPYFSRTSRPILLSTSTIEPSTVQSTTELVMTEISTVYDIETVGLPSTMSFQTLSVTPSTSESHTFSSPSRSIVKDTQLYTPDSSSSLHMFSEATTMFDSVHVTETVYLSTPLITDTFSTYSTAVELSLSFTSALRTPPLESLETFDVPSMKPTSIFASAELSYSEMFSSYDILTTEIVTTELFTTDVTPATFSISASVETQIFPTQTQLEIQTTTMIPDTTLSERIASSIVQTTTQYLLTSDQFLYESTTLYETVSLLSSQSKLVSSYFPIQTTTINDASYTVSKMPSTLTNVPSMISPVASITPASPETTLFEKGPVITSTYSSFYEYVSTETSIVATMPFSGVVPTKMTSKLYETDHSIIGTSILPSNVVTSFYITSIEPSYPPLFSSRVFSTADFIIPSSLESFFTTRPVETSFLSLDDTIGTRSTVESLSSTQPANLSTVKSFTSTPYNLSSTLGDLTSALIVTLSPVLDKTSSAPYIRSTPSTAKYTSSLVHISTSSEKEFTSTPYTGPSTMSYSNVLKSTLDSILLTTEYLSSAVSLTPSTVNDITSNLQMTPTTLEYLPSTPLPSATIWSSTLYKTSSNERDLTTTLYLKSSKEQEITPVLLTTLSTNILPSISSGIPTTEKDMLSTIYKSRSTETHYSYATLTPSSVDFGTPYTSLMSLGTPSISVSNTLSTFAFPKLSSIVSSSRFYEEDSTVLPTSEMLSKGVFTVSTHQLHLSTPSTDIIMPRSQISSALSSDTTVVMSDTVTLKAPIETLFTQSTISSQSLKSTIFSAMSNLPLTTDIPRSSQLTFQSLEPTPLYSFSTTESRSAKLPSSTLSPSSELSFSSPQSSLSHTAISSQSREIIESTDIYRSGQFSLGSLEPTPFYSFSTESRSAMFPTPTSSPSSKLSFSSLQSSLSHTAISSQSREIIESTDIYRSGQMSLGSLEPTPFYSFSTESRSAMFPTPTLSPSSELSFSSLQSSLSHTAISSQSREIIESTDIYRSGQMSLGSLEPTPFYSFSTESRSAMFPTPTLSPSSKLSFSSLQSSLSHTAISSQSREIIESTDIYRSGQMSLGSLEPTPFYSFSTESRSAMFPTPTLSPSSKLSFSSLQSSLSHTAISSQSREIIESTDIYRSGQMSLGSLEPTPFYSFSTKLRSAMLPTPTLSPSSKLSFSSLQSSLSHTAISSQSLEIIESTDIYRSAHLSLGSLEPTPFYSFSTTESRSAILSAPTLTPSSEFSFPSLQSSRSHTGISSQSREIIDWSPIFSTAFQTSTVLPQMTSSLFTSEQINPTPSLESARLTVTTALPNTTPKSSTSPPPIPNDAIVKMKLSVDKAIDISDPVFVADLEKNLEDLYTEGIKDSRLDRSKRSVYMAEHMIDKPETRGAVDRRRRDTNTQLDVTITSLSRDSTQPEEVTVIFYVTEEGTVVSATDTSAVFEDLGVAKMSAGLGLEVLELPEPVTPLPPSTTTGYPYPIPPAGDKDLLTVTMTVDDTIDISSPQFTNALENDLEILYLDGITSKSSGRRRRSSELIAYKPLATATKREDDSFGKSTERFLKQIRNTFVLFIQFFKRPSSVHRSKRKADPSTESEVVVRLVFIN